MADVSNHYNLQRKFTPITQNDITKEPTGFAEPDSVIVTQNGDRTVTLTGTVNAYYRGVKVENIVTGWTSPAHANTTTKQFFLVNDGTTTEWKDLGTTDIDFSDLLISYAFYNGANWVYLKETHGIMAWETHRAEHLNVGTYKVSGGSVTVTLDSTTEADRRPAVAETLIRDEDLTSTLAQLASAGGYTTAQNTGTGVFEFAIDGDEIVPVLGANPYYNSFSSPNWGQTLMPDNSVATVWLFAMPVALGGDNPKYRYFWVQPQWITQAQNASAGALLSARNAEEGRNINELNLTTLGDLSPEYIAIHRLTIQYTGSDWTVQNSLALTGTRFNQLQAPSGNFLSAVTTGYGLSGQGTGASPLILNITNSSDSDFDTDDVLVTTIANTDFGLLLVKETTANTGALYLLSGTAIELISGNTLVWSATKDTADKYNVYIEDNVVKVQNKVGDNKDVTIGIYKI